MTEAEAAKIVTVVLSAYPSQATRLSEDAAEPMISTYALLLADIDYEMANRAVCVLVQTEKFMPSVSEIRAACIEIERGPQRPGGDAWGDVIALRKFANLETIKQVDPITLKICQQFGWIEYRTLWRGGADIEQWHVVSGENEAADRARFIDLYDQLNKQAHRETVAPVLAAARTTRERELGGDPFQRALAAAGEKP